LKQAGPVRHAKKLREDNSEQAEHRKLDREDAESKSTSGSNSELDSSEEALNGDASIEEDSNADHDSSTSASSEDQSPDIDDTKKRSRKRKREEDDDALERRALARLADDEDASIEESSRDGEAVMQSSESASSGADGERMEQALDDTVPQHESLAKLEGKSEVEKASRTVFLGNVSTQAILSKSAKKQLTKHLSSFLAELPAANPPHKVESIRFRSTAFDSKLPKKAAFAKRELMDATTHSTNAYAVYTTVLACREAAKRLNGTVILDRHLRVDQVAHPAKTDNRRCVFVGNLDFVDDDSKIREDVEDRKKKKSKSRQPGDVEEGLWREFSKAGTIESVRVIRDQKTRVGKGFAYVQFKVRGKSLFVV
jgi:nucleolar protein 12